MATSRVTDGVSMAQGVPMPSLSTSLLPHSARVKPQSAPSEYQAQNTQAASTSQPRMRTSGQRLGRGRARES